MLHPTAPSVAEGATPAPTQVCHQTVELVKPPPKHWHAQVTRIIAHAAILIPILYIAGHVTGLLVH